jgi:hypothetical protein
MKFTRISLTWLTVVLVCGAAAAWAKPASTGPVETLQSFQKALSADPPQVQVFWTSLPTSYQTEIRKLISTFAKNTDPDLWNAGFRVLGKTAAIARQKGKFVRESALFAEFTGQRGAAGNAPFFTKPEHWDSMVTIVETIAQSKISTHEGLKKLDPERFLATTGAKLSSACIDLALAASGSDAENELERFSGGTFTLVEGDDDSATVKFVVEGNDATDIRLVKVENKWVLADLADQFEKSIAQAHKSVPQLSITAQQKTQCLTLVKAIEEGLDELLAADTQETFDATGARLAQQLPGLLGLAAQNFAGPQDLQLNESPPRLPATQPDEDPSDKPSDESSDE